MELLRSTLLLIVVILLVGCQKKPTACINIDDAVEAGSTITITSCSEDYEFLTWLFSDGRAYEDPQVQREFVEPGKYSVTLTAYAKNAYRSDETVLEFRASYRYVDYIEVIGESNFRRFEVECFETFNAPDAEGSFSNLSPYVHQVYPEREIRILPEISKVRLTGVKSNGSKTILGTETFNFETYKENPITVVGDGYEMRLYWTFGD